VKRSGIDRLLSQVSSVGFDPAIDDKSAVWHDLSRRIQDQCADPRDFSSQREAWRYLAEPREIPAAERWLLRRSGKSRDGFISRYVNRPVSRTVSRFLLRTPMTPNLWTVLITFFPILGFLFLIRGTYAGFVIGAALCNVHSILDGCDGEIARAKYLDSDKGPGVDAFGDLIALLLFSIGLGLGLSRSAQHAVSHWIFLTEGILTAVFIAMRLGPNHVLDMFRRGSKAVAFSKDDEWLSRSGGRIFGKRITSLGFELTKRDVVFSTFLIVAALGLARWILHFLFIFAVATFTLSWSGRVRRETIA
jgi:CDP-L-myo-inositol myo-inositolphosphotransferase